MVTRITSAGEPGTGRASEGDESNDASHRQAARGPPVTGRERWRALLNAPRAGDPAGVDRPLVDIGSSLATGVRDRRGLSATGSADVVGHPVQQTRVLDAAAARAVRTDVERAGFLYDRPPLDEEGRFTDPNGTVWLWADGEPTPLEHPLADSPAGIGRVPAPPRRPTRLAVPDPASGNAVIADTPGAGLLEFCFAQRGHWAFLDDVSTEPLAAASLLDVALQQAVEGYEALLGALPSGPDQVPDLVLYSDDLGYGESMFLGEAEFRALVLPRMRALVERIRELTPAALVLRTPGAIAPVLPDLVGLGVEVLNLQHDARGMDPAELRRSLPAATVLHGVTDLTALGRAVAVGDLAGVAQHAYQFARSWPVVAAPVDSLAVSELPDVVAGAVFLAGIDGDGLALLRRAGPVRSVIQRGLAAVTASEIDLGPVIAGEPPDSTFVRTVRSSG